MPILNYTTSISTAKTAQEITAILVQAGAVKIVMDIDGPSKEAVALTFAVAVGPENLLWWFTLPANWQGVQKALVKSKVEQRYRSEDQARRVAWRIIKSWCEAQLAIIEAGQASLAEVFLPYAQTDSGQTLYQVLAAGKVNLLR